MTYTIEDYLNLVTSEHRDKPKYIAMIREIGKIFVTIQDVMLAFGPAFDLDDAIGAQLDVIGLWAGISRNVNIPIEDVYFSWDGTDSTVGWDFGTWRPSNSPTVVTTLPDDSYRVLIRAKIAANSWDGTTEGAYRIWSDVFPALNILIQDNSDLSYDLIIVGGVLDSLTQALITQGYIPLKPEGIKVNNYYVPVNPDAAFGWDLDNDYIKGWDEGSWTKQIPST